MTTIVRNKVSRQAQLQQILSGIGKRFSTVSSLTLGGVSYTPADLEKLIQGELGQMAASAQAKAAYTAEVELERETRAKLNPVLRQLKSYVLGIVGDSSSAADELAEFGYTPRKKRQPKVTVKAAAQEKSKATREARGTKGPRQKAEIKGQVPETKPAPQPTPAKA